MSEVWDQARIQQYKTNQIQESLNLDYKGADALDKRNPKRNDNISKDVSAMANSAGGLIIYGIMEKDQLPHEITPIDATKVTREWLEQVINSTIQPRISGITIHPVPLDTSPNDTIYVVEIPQSITAHQANDKKYYKRFNFESVPMEDYEIRDIMNRSKHPNIELNFEIEVRREHRNPSYPIGDPVEICYLKTRATNIANVYANYVNCVVYLPISFCPPDEINLMVNSKYAFQEDGEYFYEYYKENTVRDMVDGSRYGPSRYSPILPGRSREWETRITKDMNQILAMKQGDARIKWEVYADNAPVNRGITPVAAIPMNNRGY